MSSFGRLPEKRKSTPDPFTVSVPEEQLNEFKTLLKLSKIAPKTFENESTDGHFGINRDWLIQAKAEWEKWDWRQCESRINSFPNFTLPIEDQEETFNIHFVALFSQNADAIPVMLLHGWPGSFMEFFSILDLCRERFSPETLPYHVIVPSLPGYAFSSGPPLARDLRLEDIARIMNTLMLELGLGSGYVVQGGDIGSFVSRMMAATYDSVKAAHLNLCAMTRPKDVDDSDMTPMEKEGSERLKNFEWFEAGYMFEQATRPGTIGLVLASNPIALLAWIGEKFLAWSDKEPAMDDILASVTLYWMTESFPRSIYPYRQFLDPTATVGIHANPKWHIDKPFGYSFFPKDFAPTPRSWAATTGQLVFYRQHESGGHFAAMEKPDVLLDDLEAFISQVWK